MATWDGMDIEGFIDVDRNGDGDEMQGQMHGPKQRNMKCIDR